MRGIYQAPLARAMRLEFTGEEGCGVVEITVHPEIHTTTDGYLHSSVYMTLVEMAAGSIDERAHVAQNVTATMMRPAKAGSRVIARGQILKAGRTMITGQTMIYVVTDNGEKLIGTGTANYVVTPPPSAQ